VALTFGQFKAKLRPLVWPTGEAPNLVAAHDQSIIDGLLDLQAVVPCLQSDQTNTYPACATLYNCGLTVFDGPRGFITRLEVIDKVDEKSSAKITASKVGGLITASDVIFKPEMAGAASVKFGDQKFPILEVVDESNVTVADTTVAITDLPFSIVTGPDGDDDNWCSNIEYREVDICAVHAYIRRNRLAGCCFPPAFFFSILPEQCRKGAFPIPTDVGVPKSLPVLPLGHHYAQSSTDSTHGRARQGIWAKERGKIYIAPWIQSTETAVLTWDGLKRTWSDSDPIDEDPMLLDALVEYARFKHADKWAKDDAEAARAWGAYELARAKLIYQCREETRVRRCEPSLARSAPGTLYYNEQQTATASCPDGETGNSVTEIIPASSVASTKSVADANAIAKKQAQEQAAARLDCVPTPVTYWNTPQTYVATCAQTAGAPIPDGSPVTITIPANSYSSTVSQAAADALALAAATEQANNGLSCTWWNAEQTATCPDGQNGSPVTVAEHTYSSDVSQAVADSLALNAAKGQLSCSGGDFWNTQQTTKVIINGCNGHPTCQVIIDVTIAAHYVHNSTSQAAANQDAINFGQNFGSAYGRQKCLLGQCGNYLLNIP